MSLKELDKVLEEHIDRLLWDYLDLNYERKAVRRNTTDGYYSQTVYEFDQEDIDEAEVIVRKAMRDHIESLRAVEID